MKKSKIIVPALGMIAFATAASITGTVAWFTANNSVKITGMSFTTKVQDNLYIADNTTEATFTDDVFTDQLVQSITARLEPTSSVDGLNYYYTTSANSNGSAKANAVFQKYSETTSLNNTTAKKENYDLAFNTAFNVGTPINSTNVIYGYVDYTFYLKATYVSASNLFMDKCNLLYNNAAITEKAWRVALFVQDASATTTDGVTTVTSVTTALADGNRKTILAPTGAANFVSGKAVNGLVDIDAEHLEYGKTATRDTVTYGDAAVLDTVANASTKFYKVTARLWLEGEDKTCNVDTFKTLTQSYSLELNFKTDTATTSAVAVIGSVVTPAP